MHKNGTTYIGRQKCTTYIVPVSGRIIAKLTPTFILLNMSGQGVFRAASVFPEACMWQVTES